MVEFGGFRAYIAEYIDSQIGFKYVEHGQIPPKMLCMRDTTTIPNVTFRAVSNVHVTHKTNKVTLV